MAKALGHDAACSNDDASVRDVLTAIDRARHSIADKIDEWNFSTAVSRSRRGEDINPQIDILKTNHRLRIAILALPATRCDLEP